MANILIGLFVLLVQISVSVHSFNQWDHAVDMNVDYRLLWSINDKEITFEVQARTLGYVGFGFSRDGTIYGADVVVGWVDQGRAYFQVSILMHQLKYFYPLFIKKLLISTSFSSTCVNRP